MQLMVNIYWQASWNESTIENKIWMINQWGKCLKSPFLHMAICHHVLFCCTVSLKLMLPLFNTVYLFHIWQIKQIYTENYVDVELPIPDGMIFLLVMCFHAFHYQIVWDYWCVLLGVVIWNMKDLLIHSVMQVWVIWIYYRWTRSHK